MRGTSALTRNILESVRGQSIEDQRHSVRIFTIEDSLGQDHSVKMRNKTSRIVLVVTLGLVFPVQAWHPALSGVTRAIPRVAPLTRLSKQSSPEDWYNGSNKNDPRLDQELTGRMVDGAPLYGAAVDEEDASALKFRCEFSQEQVCDSTNISTLTCALSL